MLRNPRLVRSQLIAKPEAVLVCAVAEVALLVIAYPLLYKYGKSTTTNLCPNNLKQTLLRHNENEDVISAERCILLVSPRNRR